MSMQWEGMDEFQAALHKYPNVVNKTGRETLYQEGERIMTHIKRAHLVPIDDGHLVNSGFVDKPVQSITGHISVLMGFGGLASAYALYQHEGYFEHTVGKRKYLEDPVNAARQRVNRRLTQAISDALRKATP